MEFLSYGKQWIDQDDIDAVVKTLKSDFLTQGPKVKEFEEKICNITGAKYCIAVSNGTAALHLAVKSLNIKKGMEGITSPITFVASSNAMIYNDLKPNFADIDEKTYCVDPEKIREKITENTRLIIPVHFAGQPCDMQRIYKIAIYEPRAKSRQLFIIEDASHAIGGKYKNGKNIGSCCHSDMTIFSFHPVKTITSAEGGAITTNNEKLYEKLLMLRTHGITNNNSKFNKYHSKLNEPWYYEMQELGYNYRLSDIHSALGISQLSKLDMFKKGRNEIIDQYNKAFEKTEWIEIPYQRKGLDSTFHLYVLKIDFKTIRKSRTEVMNILKERNIGTQVHYIPVHTQPYYKKNYGYEWGNFPIAEKYYEKALSIPLFPKMNDDNIDYVIENILKLGK